MSPLHALQRAPTPEQPGPGPMPEALLRALDVRIGRRVNGLLAGDYRSALQGHGRAKRSQLRMRQARRKAMPMGTTGNPVRAAR